MTENNWEPRHVTGWRRELIHAEEQLKTLDRERDECRDRIATLKNRIQKETEVPATVTTWAGSAE